MGLPIRTAIEIDIGGAGYGRGMTWGETLRDQLDFYWAVHLWPRLVGLTDDEYVGAGGGAWTLRADRRRLPRSHCRMEPPVPPVTTIAWRIAHVGRDVLGKRARAFFGDPSLPVGTTPPDDAIMFDPRWWPEPLPATADDALAFLDRAYGLWRDGVAALDDDALLRPLGPKGEHHADQSMAALVMHINREVIAHGAEICLLRDLYRAQHDGRDPLVAAARRGDGAEVSRLLDGGAEVSPSLLTETAGLRHWDVVRALVEHGAAVEAGTEPCTTRRRLRRAGRRHAPPGPRRRSGAGRRAVRHDARGVGGALRPRRGRGLPSVDRCGRGDSTAVGSRARQVRIQASTGCRHAV